MQIFTTYLDLKNDMDPGDAVIQYKDFVLASRLQAGPLGCYFTVEAFAPVETVEETGFDFHELRLVRVDEWSQGERFDTEGEALLAAMLTLDSLVAGGAF